MDGWKICWQYRQLRLGLMLASRSPRTFVHKTSKQNKSRRPAEYRNFYRILTASLRLGLRRLAPAHRRKRLRFSPAPTRKEILLAEYRAAMELYSTAVAELTGRIGTRSRNDYLKLHHAAEVARLRFSEARARLESHFAQHECGTSESDKVA